MVIMTESLAQQAEAVAKKLQEHPMISRRLATRIVLQTLQRVQAETWAQAAQEVDRHRRSVSVPFTAAEHLKGLSVKLRNRASQEPQANG